MRILPNYLRLRLVALSCWVVSGWCVVQGARLAGVRSIFSILVVGVALLALLLAIGVAFWQLSKDKRAGIVFDTKVVCPSPFVLRHSSPQSAIIPAVPNNRSVPTHSTSQNAIFQHQEQGRRPFWEWRLRPGMPGAGR